MIKPRIQIKLAVVGMVALIPMIAFPQTTESAIEATPSVAEVAAGNTQQSGGENNMNSDFSENADFQTLPYNTAKFEVYIQTQFNEIRSELLDEQALFIDRWLNLITIILTFVGVVVAFATFVGFSRFRAIEKKANASVKSAAAAEEEAKNHLQEIQKISEKAAEKLSDLDASVADANPTEAYQTVTRIRDNPDASPIEMAIADALALQQQGKQKDAIKKWRAIAEITEESNNALAARAWFSIGFLSSVENITKKISSYDRAIQLKPDMAVAYSNRGNTKGRLGQHEDAISDYDKAIQLEPDFAVAYSNRGNTKGRLGRHEDAITDYDKAIQLKPDYARAYFNRGNSKYELGFKVEAKSDLKTALRLARNSDNEDLINLVEQNLHSRSAINGD